MSPGGMLNALACHPTKKISKAEHKPISLQTLGERTFRQTFNVLSEKLNLENFLIMPFYIASLFLFSLLQYKP
jgi:hypothetical protein